MVARQESQMARCVTWKLDGPDQLICCFHSRVVGFKPSSGEELWSVESISSDRSDVCYAMPMLADRNVVVMAGYGGPEFGFKIGENGAVAEIDRLWRNEKTEPKGYHPQRIGTGVSLGR